jgi:Domain of unknown function (DUF4432)/TIR domain
MSGQIFISYRREESSAWAGRLSDRLSNHFPSNQIFMDVDSVDPGEDFVKTIEKTVGSRDVLIAVISKGWLSSCDQERFYLSGFCTARKNLSPVLRSSAMDTLLPAPVDLVMDQVLRRSPGSRYDAKRRSVPPALITGCRINNSKCSYQLCSSEQVAKLPRANSKAAWVIFPKCASAPLPNAWFEPQTLAVLHNAAGELGVSLSFNIQQLPVLSLWKNTDTIGQGYVTGLEPGTSWAYNRSYQRALNRVPTIGPKEQCHFDITYTFLADKSAVDSALQQVQKIQHDRPTEVRKSPLVDLPKN